MNRRTNLAEKSLPLEKRGLRARRSTGKTTRNTQMEKEMMMMMMMGMRKR
jgi:hypothetical protein